MKIQIYNFIYLIKKIYSKIFLKETRLTGRMRNPYRQYLFEELKLKYGKEYFKDKRILEIGPKDGEDTLRLDTLSPSILILNELAEIKEETHPVNTFYKNNLIPNLQKVESEYELIFGNINYLNQDELNKLGKFDLIWFTGVIYHIPEQLRTLRKLYNLLDQNGTLVLETSTTRNPKLINEEVVEIIEDGAYFFPSRKAINRLLKLAGFSNISESNCYDNENFNKKGIRLALFAEKLDSNENVLHRDKYIFGEAF
jgi:SAM-dependent methyltransferase